MARNLDTIGEIYRNEYPRVLATLIRLLGDFEVAEEAAQDAFIEALEHWPGDGVPGNPAAWLISTGRFKAIDRLRRDRRMQPLPDEWEPASSVAESADPDMLEDDRLRLIFTCCHPALAIEAQVALTLRTLCGLETEQIARAFLVPLPTMAQRLVRAKQKIRDARIPYRVPPANELGERLDAVLLVLYLVFNEGYSASGGDHLINRELCREAIRMARLLCGLIPKRPELRALLALLLLQDSRREARVSADGEIVLLEEQDRSLWDAGQISEGLALVESALRAGARGPYALQAAIAALHAQAARPEDTDWRQIAALYSLLLETSPSPVVELNRAAAIAMADGPAEGLRLLSMLENRPELRDYYLLPSAKADLLRRLGRWAEAREAYRASLMLVRNAPERKFLLRRAAEMEARLR
jgi:RNA polymerase sigma-70 factor (ECF subfamily)